LHDFVNFIFAHSGHLSGFVRYAFAENSLRAEQ
jgi:hypothetical protein